MKVPYKEIFKLKVMLEKEKIPYEFYDKSRDNAYSDGSPYIHYQIMVRKPNSAERLISVIQGNGTYGSNQDLLEIMGCLTDEEEKEDCVKGRLTAKEVLKRIKNKFNVNKDDSITKKVTLLDLEQINRRKKMEELEILAKPLQEWLIKNYNPHCLIIIKDGNVKLEIND